MVISFKIVSSILIILLSSSFSFAGGINPDPEFFESCKKVTDNTYSCKFDKDKKTAGESQLTCQGNSCTITVKQQSKQGDDYVIYGYNNMPYTLCSKAECTIDTRNPNKAYCNCPIVNTTNNVASISIGPDKRTKSLPEYDAKGNMVKVTSTYSMMNIFDFKNYQHATLCKYKQTQGWVDCFGIRCNVDKKNALNAICHCPVRKTKECITFKDKCSANPDQLIPAIDIEQYELGLPQTYKLYKHFGWLHTKR